MKEVSEVNLVVVVFKVSKKTQMESQDITKLLVNWGYDQPVIDKFKDEAIEVGHLLNLTEYSLEKLFPKIGERTEFMLKLKMLDQEVPAKRKRMACDSDTLSMVSTLSTHFSSTSNNTSPLEELFNGAEGKIIISFYKTEKKLNDFYRQKLADEIVRYELRNDIRKCFPHSMVEYWCNLIIEYFAEESYEVWAGCTQGKNRASSAGRGILINRYYNMRRKLIKVGAISKTQSDIHTIHTHTDTDTDDESDELINWLQNTRTVSLVLENWERTTAKRLSLLNGSKAMEIHTYMDTFPAIKCSDGYRLLEVDFSNMYPDAVMQLYCEWPTLISFILSRIPLKEQTSINDCCSSDGKKLKTLRALSLLLPVRSIVMGKKRQWRPSRLESKDSLFQYVKSVTDIQPTIMKKKEKFYELGLKLGPQLFAVTQDEDIIDACYLMINDTIYNIDSPLKAFDVFFKTFHSLHSCYPKETEREMYFLQKAVYNIDCYTDKKIRETKSLGLINEYAQYKMP